MIEIGFALLCQSLFAILSWRLLWPQLPPIARRAGMVLFACQVAIFLLYAYSRYGVGTSQYTKWLFNLQMESNLSATFSTIQILLVACISGDKCPAKPKDFARFGLFLAYHQLRILFAGDR